MLAALGGVLTGSKTSTIIVKAADGSKTRITASVNADEERTSMLLDAT